MGNEIRDFANDPDDILALPRKNGELVFDAPWESRVFGMTVALCDRGLFPWEDFRQRLIRQVAIDDQRGNEDNRRGYYQQWLAAFEELLLDHGLIAKDDLLGREVEFAKGEREILC